MLHASRYYALAGTLLLIVALVGQPMLPALPEFAFGLLYGLAGGLLLVAVVRAFRPDSCDDVTPALRRRYLREFMPAIIGYVVALFLSLWLLKRVDAPAMRALIALLPVPAIALAMRAIMRRIRDADELQRRIELEAVSIASAFVSLAYLAAGFLQRAGVVDVPSSMAMIWVFPLLCFTFGLCRAVLSRRYR